ncbi:hypothetical protein MTO96_050921 [Rhipicephalus appendiculatus]
MLIFRGQLTHHPRGSTSVPAMSPHYWIPPTSISSAGISEVQSMLAPLSARMPQCAPPPPPSNGQRDGSLISLEIQDEDDNAVSAASSQSLNADFADRPSDEKTRTRGVILVSALLVFGVVLAIMLVVGQALQPRELQADDPMLTEVVRQPLVQEPSSGHAYGDDPATAVHDNAAALAAATNRSKAADTDDRVPSAATVVIRGHSILPGRRATKAPLTSSVSTSGVNSTVNMETTERSDEFTPNVTVLDFVNKNH